MRSDFVLLVKLSRFVFGASHTTAESVPPVPSAGCAHSEVTLVTCVCPWHVHHQADMGPFARCCILISQGGVKSRIWP